MIRNAFITGIQKTLQYWQITVLVYLIQFFLALLVVMPLYALLESTIGNSNQLEHLMYGFDNTVIGDFLNEYGVSLNGVMAVGQWALGLYFFVWLFLSGGILHIFIQATDTFRWSTFFGACAKYFKKMLLNALFFIGSHLLIAFVWYSILSVFWSNPWAYFETEKGLFIITGVFVMIHLGIISIINLWSDCSKLSIVLNKSSVWQSIKTGFSYLRSYFKTLYGLFLLNTFVLIIAYGLYWLVEHFSGMVSPILIVIFILIQQVLILTRLGFKLARLRSYLEVFINTEE